MPLSLALIAAEAGRSLARTRILLDRDLAGFQQRVKHACAAVRQAVQDELARHQRPEAAANGRANGNSGSRTNGNGQRNGHHATDKQAEYLRRLSQQIPGLAMSSRKGARAGGEKAATWVQE